MTVFMNISYDLVGAESQRYQSINRLLSTCGEVVQHQRSCWYILTPLTPDEVAALLRSYIYQRDKLSIVPLSLDLVSKFRE